MPFYSNLDEITKRYKGDILIINDFVNSTYETLDDLSKILEKHKDDLTNEDSEALRAVAKALSEAADANHQNRKRSWKIPTTARVGEIIHAAARNMKSKGFLAEMALSYVISLLEGFLKDYFEEVLYNRPEMLRSGKTLSYEDALQFRSMATLKRHLASIETDALGYGSIDDVEGYLQAKINIAVREEPFWPYVREASYRRNLIIHNRGIVNKVYRFKTGMQTGTPTLETNREYLNNATGAIIEFIDFIHRSVARKLKLTKGEGPVREGSSKANPHQVSVTLSDVAPRAKRRGQGPDYTPKRSRRRGRREAGPSQ